MQTPEEFAREALEQVRGPMLSIFKGAEHDEWQDALSVLVDQEAEFVADLIRARDAEVAERAWDEGFTRGFYTGTSGQYGPASDASEIDVTNPYERTEPAP